MSKVETGRYVDLPEKRLVFVGRFADEPDSLALAFKNSDGEVTRIKLSLEAATALGDLLTNPVAGTKWDGDSSLLAQRMVFQWIAKVTLAGDASVEPLPPS